MGKKAALQQLVEKGERIYNNIPKVSSLPRGKDEVTQSFLVVDPEMAEIALQIGLDAVGVVNMINGEKWNGIRLKPIDAALLAPAFESDQQKRIAAALELVQREFWEEQHFYLDEMAGARASDIPNVFMRETSLAVEERVFSRLRQQLSETGAHPIVWIDYAAGPASFVNGTLHQLRMEGFDLRRVVVVLVEPAKPFREFAQRQPILNELWQEGRLHFVDGILEDGETYEKVNAISQKVTNHKADIVTQAFGASYIADHLRPAMWKEMFNTGKPHALKIVIANTNKFNPSRMITDRLKDEIRKRRPASANKGLDFSIIPAVLQGLQAWIVAFVRPVPVDLVGNKQAALAALIKYGQGIKQYCPIRQSGEAFADEIEQATLFRAKGITPVLDEQAVLIEL